MSLSEAALTFASPETLLLVLQVVVTQLDAFSLAQIRILAPAQVPTWGARPVQSWCICTPHLSPRITYARVPGLSFQESLQSTATLGLGARRAVKFQFMEEAPSLRGVE